MMGLTKMEQTQKRLALSHMVEEQAGATMEDLVAVEEADADIAGDIEIIERLGAETYAYVRVAGQPADLTLRLPGETGHRPGSRIGLKLDWSRAHWFDADGRVL